jgi:hypothetical protein
VDKNPASEHHRKEVVSVELEGRCSTSGVKLFDYGRKRLSVSY